MIEPLTNKSADKAHTKATLGETIGLDPQWIYRCVKNDRVAQEHIYRLYFMKATRQCQRYTQDEDALISIVNDAFMKVFKKIGQFDFNGSFEGWLRRVVFTTMADHFRKRKDNISFIDVPEQTEQGVPALDKMYLDDLLALINQLPETSKTVFMKYHMEGFNHREIGEMMDFSEGTSKWHLHQARKLLQDLTKNIKE